VALANTVTPVIVNELTKSSSTKYELDQSTMDGYFIEESSTSKFSKFCGITYGVFSDSSATKSLTHVSISSQTVTAGTQEFM